MRRPRLVILIRIFTFRLGRIRGGKFYVGDIDGLPGKSPVVAMESARRGLWFDFATDMGGDVFDAWSNLQGLCVLCHNRKTARETARGRALYPSGGALRVEANA